MMAHNVSMGKDMMDQLDLQHNLLVVLVLAEDMMDMENIIYNDTMDIIISL